MLPVLGDAYLSCDDVPPPIPRTPWMPCHAASGPACRATRSPVVILPAFLSSSDAPEYGELQQTLCELGHPTGEAAAGHAHSHASCCVLPTPAKKPHYGKCHLLLCAEVIKVSFSDWVPVLRGGSFSWYLSRAAPLVRRLADEHGAPVSLVGISAGGWLARLAVGSAVYDGARLVCGQPLHPAKTAATSTLHPGHAALHNPRQHLPAPGPSS